MALGFIDFTVLDTPNPRGLAEFYRAIIGGELRELDQGRWVTLRPERGNSIAFQLAPDLVAPTWPDPTVPQQSHLDIYVDEMEPAEAAVLAAGATKTGLPERNADGSEPDFRVYLDPAGHPFCLCLP